MSKRTPKISPRNLLLPYQQRWVEDKTRFKFGLWSRQTGKDFSTGCEIVESCISTPKTTWLIGAAGERQALESLEKVKEWAEAFKFAIEDYAEDRESAQALLASGKVTWANGSRVIAVPANPNTVRGFSANVVLTEFAFLEQPDETWRAILPSITNPLRGGEKSVRIITTPNGVGNKAHELWIKENLQWSKHKVTIHDAVRDGLPINVEQLREAIDDPEGWAQEFECEFMDVSSVLLPYDLLASCESSEATATASVEWWNARKSNTGLFIGIDFGRKKDLSVAWTLEKLGDVAQTREVLEMPKMSTPDQVNLLKPRLARAQRVCVDYTGPGIGLGDYLVKEFGEYDPAKDKFGKIELCTFSNTLKQEIFSKLKMAFEQRVIRIPQDRNIREDLHSIHRVTTQTGIITYKAPHTPDGHADRATALALAMRAIGQGGGLFHYARVYRRGKELI